MYSCVQLVKLWKWLMSTGLFFLPLYSWLPLTDISCNGWCVDGNPGDAAVLFERAQQHVKVKKYSEALNDLNAAIEADPALSEAYWHRASVLRQLCRFHFNFIIGN